MVEFTTRDPIRPVPDQELVYAVEIDTDEPWTNDSDDRDFLGGVALHPDGGLTPRWDAARAAIDAYPDDNRIGLLIDAREFSGRVSVSAFSKTWNTLDGSWGRWGDDSRSAAIGFPEVAAAAPTDLSEPSSRPSPTQYEVFRYVAIRDRDQGVADVSCRIIEVLGDHFDFFAFNSEFRVDLQGANGPGHGFAGFYAGNIQAEVEGIGIEGDYTTPCESRLKNSWGFPVWMKAVSMMRESYAEDGHRTPYDDGLTVFAHEIGHTWLANASYLAGGERKSMQTAEHGAHWALEVHAPASFPWREQYNGSVMGGAYWRENSDGTFTATSGWTTRGGGFSWLDLYLMGLATPDEVPDMFILRNLRREGPCTAESWECERFGPFAADKEIVTMEQVLAAMGPRNPPAERARKAYNMGFVYFLLPGQTPDPELLRKHAEYRDRALEHWRHITGGRSQLTTAVASPTAPSAPRNLTAVGGDGQVVLSWTAPENDGGFAITDYEYRINGRGSWISIGSTQTTHTVTGLTNGTAYVFQVRAVNAAGSSPYSNQAEATPGVGALDFAHFGNGVSGNDVLITSDLVLVNVAENEIRPVIYFFDRAGNLLEAESVVDLGDVLEVEVDGGLSPTTAMVPLGELTISTHGRGEVVTGSVRVVSDGPIGGVVRFDIPGIGVAGVGASDPTGDALFPARRQAGGIRTAAAIHNLGMEAVDVQCRLMKNGVVLEEIAIELGANGQDARFIEELFTATDTTDFVGSVRCTVPHGGLFTGVAVELDAGNRIFTTLPVVPVDPEGGEEEETTLTFAHFANGTSGDGTLITSDLVLVNVAASMARPAIYFYDQRGELLDPESTVDVGEDLVVREDGGLTVRTAMARLGELTISTHGRGEVVTGSVRVVANGPIGGVLRFDIPGVGVAGVGASQATADALFPARRQAGGIRTAAAIRNLAAQRTTVRCWLMSGGQELEWRDIPLDGHGQYASFIEEVFTRTDTRDFVGSVRCTAAGDEMFTGVAIELDTGNQVFTTLPVVPIQR